MTITINRREYTVFQTADMSKYANVVAHHEGLKAVYYAEGKRGALVEIWEYEDGKYRMFTTF